MSNRLIVFLVSVCVFTLAILFHMVKKRKILYKHALMWGLFDVILLIFIFNVKYLRFLADFIGIEKVSNMIFLFAFFIVIAICIALSSIVSEQKNKIIKLTQEMGLINKMLRDGYNEDNKNDIK